MQDAAVIGGVVAASIGLVKVVEMLVGHLAKRRGVGEEAGAFTNRDRDRCQAMEQWAKLYSQAADHRHKALHEAMGRVCGAIEKNTESVGELVRRVDRLIDRE